MAARQIIVPGAMPSRDANGRALPAKFRFYMGGSNVPTTVYADAALTVPHEFPILSDSGGRWPQIWADDALSFNVGWSDQVHDATIRTFENVQTVKDALLASADIANAAADAAIAARDVTQGIATKFGDVDAAITAAQTAQEAAETAQASAEQILNGPGGVAQLRNETEDFRDEARQARDEAQAIAGFDPSTYLNTGAAQSFTEPAKVQGRANLGAQPVLALVDRQKIARPAIAAGVLNLDCAAASAFVVSWNANITDLNLTGLAAGTDAQTITLILVAAGGTSFAPGAGFSVIGDAPLFNTAAGARNYLTLTTQDGGAQVDYAFAGAAA